MDSRNFIYTKKVIEWGSTADFTQSVFYGTCNSVPCFMFEIFDHKERRVTNSVILTAHRMNQLFNKIEGSDMLLDSKGRAI